MGKPDNERQLVEMIVEAVANKAESIPGMEKAGVLIKVVIMPLSENDGVEQKDVYRLETRKLVENPPEYPRYLTQTVCMTVQDRVPIKEIDKVIGSVRRLVDLQTIEVSMLGAKRANEAYACIKAAAWGVQRYYKTTNQKNISIKGPDY